MKKCSFFSLLCIVLVILVGCASNSSVSISKRINENFSIRDGIQFGMTKDEVKEIENSTMEIYESLYENFEGPVRTANSEDLYNRFHTMRVDRNVLGSFGMIYFYFDNDYKLIDMGYELGENDYDYYYKLLKEKYGKPLSENVAKYIYGIENSPLIDTIPLYNLPSSHTVYANNTYWIVEYKDCTVLVSLNDGVNKVDRIGSYPVCFIGYKKITKEAIEQAINDAKDREKERETNKEKSIETNF